MASARGADDESAWDERVCELHGRASGAGGRILAAHGRRAAGDWSEFADKAIATIDAAGESVATRKASLIALNAFAPALPEMAGGSADLTGSNLTKHNGSIPISGDDAAGNYVWFGVREFGMTAICNGMRCTAADCRTRARF